MLPSSPLLHQSIVRQRSPSPELSYQPFQSNRNQSTIRINEKKVIEFSNKESTNLMGERVHLSKRLLFSSIIIITGSIYGLFHL